MYSVDEVLVVVVGGDGVIVVMVFSFTFRWACFIIVTFCVWFSVPRYEPRHSPTPGKYNSYVG